MAAFPGLSFGHSLVLSHASTAAASVLPGGDAVGIAYLVLDAAALGLHGRAGRPSAVPRRPSGTRSRTSIFSVAAVVVPRDRRRVPSAADHGCRGSAVLPSPWPSRCSPSALNADDNARLVGKFAERLWNRVAAPDPPRAGGRTGTSGSSASGARRSACCGAAGPPLTLTTLAGHLTVFLVLLVALRAVGVPRTDVSVGRGVRRLGPDPGPHHDPDHARRDRRRGARPDGRARLVRRAARARSSRPCCSTAC